MFYRILLISNDNKIGNYHTFRKFRKNKISLVILLFNFVFSFSKLSRLKSGKCHKYLLTYLVKGFKYTV